MKKLKAIRRPFLFVKRAYLITKRIISKLKKQQLRIMKTKFLNLILFSITMLGQNACREAKKNYGLTTYKGKIIEKGSTTTIKNCPVLIHGSEVKNPWGNAETPTIVETVSDSNGNYSLTWDAKEGKRYFIYPESLKHYGNSKGQPVWELKQFGKTITKDLEQWALAFVKIKLLNRHIYNDYDQITIGSNLSGTLIYPGSGDINYITSVWGNMNDTVYIVRRKGLEYVSVKKFGVNVKAWQMDSITSEY